MADIIKPPQIFISYAWENDTRIWARELATRLRTNGVHAILDQWDCSWRFTSRVYGDFCKRK